MSHHREKQNDADSKLPPLRYSWADLDELRSLARDGNLKKIESLLQSFGTKDADFLFGLLRHPANAGILGPSSDEQEMRFLLAYVRNSQPRDETEALLRSVMVATYANIMREQHRLSHAQSLAEHDSAANALAKLLRTFNAQMEALQTYCDRREGIEQRGLAVDGYGQAAERTAAQVLANPAPALQRVSRPVMKGAGETRQAPSIPREARR